MSLVDLNLCRYVINAYNAYSTDDTPVACLRTHASSFFLMHAPLREINRKIQGNAVYIIASFNEFTPFYKIKIIIRKQIGHFRFSQEHG